MLSRHAEGMFWMGRYIERAADLARMLDVASNTQLERSTGSAGEVWRDVLRALYLEDEFMAAHGDEVTTGNINRFIVLDRDNPSSVAKSVAEARTNVMNVRDIVPHELLEAVNRLYQLMSSPGLAQLVDTPHELYESVTTHCRAISGAIAEAMSRNDEYRYLMLGRVLERGEMTCRMIDVNRDSTDLGAWMPVLRSVSGFHAFIREHGPLAEAHDAVRFLLLEPTFPFAVMHCLAGATVFLSEVSGAGTWKSPRTLGRLAAELQYADIPPPGSEELGELVDRLERGIRAVGQALHHDLYQFGGDPSLFSFEAV